MFPIPLYYIWTPKYEIFHHIFKDSLNCYKNVVEPRPIFLSQEEFDKTIKESNSFGGWFLKIDTILDLLQTLPEDSYFIFSDADMYFFPEKQIKELLELSINSKIDITLMRESNLQNFSNIGFMLIRVCDQTRELFKMTHDIFDSGTNSTDQGLVNMALEKFTGTHANFPTIYVLTTCTVIEIRKNKENYDDMFSKAMIFQPLPDGRLTGFEKRINKIMQFVGLGIDLTSYDPIKFQE
jgi:hypothetical protein